MVVEGEKAPDFELVGSDGKKHTLKEFKGKTLVLYFYPKDNTPGCTTEAKNFNKSIEKIRELGAEVVGVSKDDTKSHEKFCNKYSLNFLLLSDPDSSMIKSYGAYGDRGIFGMGTMRKTYIIDKNGKVSKIFEKVKPDKHNEEVIEILTHK
ncbi:MAG: peroxiredoxin [Candidatus Micrarchaeia archaeon]